MTVANPILDQPAPSLWEHIAELKPRLRKDVRIRVQYYRGERWYILHDESSGNFNRFNASAFKVIGRLNGDFSIQEILHLANTSQHQDQALKPEDIMQILAQLHNAEVLRDGLPHSAQEIINRYTQTQHSRKKALSNPLSLRIPLFDPDRLLNHLAPLSRMVFSHAGLYVWTGIMLFASLLAIANFQLITTAIGAKSLSTAEVVSFWILFPAIKILHELGHGMAVKAWGGEVHETGITLLVFMPVPYVNASAASAFRDKKRRVMVGAAGIFVEMLLAAFGLFIWLLTEPGTIHDAALNIALIGSVSTLLFNGNPLLKFDGYYVLEDQIEIPNLASRSARFYLYLMQKHILGLSDTRSPVTADGEYAWFAFYGLASPLYRLTVLVSIALYLSTEFLIVGVILACWAIFMQLVKPLILTLLFLATSQRLEARRTRGFIALGAILISCGGLLIVPVPLITQAQGIITFNEKGNIHSTSDSFVKEVLVSSDSQVTSGELLLLLEDETLLTQQKTLEARLSELQTQQFTAQQRSRVRGAMVTDDINAVAAELQEISSRINKLQVRSPLDGRFILHNPHELRGKFIRHGEILGYVIQDKKPTVRAAITQKSAGLLRDKPVSIEIMLADQIGTPIQATLLREVPAGSKQLPSAALGALGGGYITVDTNDQSGLTATQKIFQLDLTLPEGTQTAGIGGRVYIRLNHGSEPLWKQWTRSTQQLLLSHLSI
jgi:putative peptide zinc metalloprotease protein